MAASALILAAALGAVATPDCAPDPQLSYICGPERPEDLVVLAGTPWLISSGFAPGAGLKLIDTRNGTFRRWYDGSQGQTLADRSSFPGCPGPVDPALFNARGLALRRLGQGRWELLVVNHGGRETVEVFEIVSAGSSPPRLRWRGCLPMPAGQVGNAVASFADGTVLVTVLTRPGTTIADFVQGRITGGVWQWRPGEDRFRLLPGTELPGNNGLATDPDQRHFYVVAFGWHSIVAYDRRETREPVWKALAPGFMPDNIHWSGGRLLLAGMRLDEPACGGRRKVVNGVADPMLCHRGWVVGALDRRRRAVRIVAEGPPQPGFNGLSAATMAGRRLWLGSFQSNRIAWLPLPAVLADGEGS